MTLAFDKFMEQYNMTGREKADGYSRDMLVGLEPDEKDTVFKLLTKEIPWSAEWLLFLDKDKALSFLKQKENELRGNPYADVYRIQEQLVKYSGDLTYQKHMIDDYPNYVTTLKSFVVDSIDRTPSNRDTIDFFKKIILVEVDEDAVAGASVYLLDSIGVPHGTDAEENNYSRLIKNLRSHDIEIKRRALVELEMYEKAAK
jgi:hypothetical protein